MKNITEDECLTPGQTKQKALEEALRTLSRIHNESYDSQMAKLANLWLEKYRSCVYR